MIRVSHDTAPAANQHAALTGSGHVLAHPDDNSAMTSTRRYAVHIFRRLWRHRFLVLTSSLVVTAVTILILRLTGPPYTGSKYNFNIMVFGETQLPNPTQTDVDYIADTLQVIFTVVYNDGGKYHLSNYTFINTGSDVIRPSKWRIYFYSLTLIEHFSYPYPDGFYLSDCGLKVFHFNGVTYWFEPVGGYFMDVHPGSAWSCFIKAKWSNRARTDSMPNWYVTGNSLQPMILASTAGKELSFVTPHERPEQYGLYGKDPVALTSVESRYESFIRSKEHVPVQILPTPLESVINYDKDKLFKWDARQVVVVTSSDFPETAKYLAEKLGLKLVTSKPQRNYISFIKNNIDVSGHDVIHEEAYTMTSESRELAIQIAAVTETGAFYGVQTLLSILCDKTTSSTSQDTQVYLIPSFHIKDAPRYHYRGIHIDVARNFQSSDWLQKVMEAMAMYKLNKLHLHLSDDEGWRLQIPRIPKLTEIGSKRCHDPDEKHCLMPMLGSGPYINTSGSGYFDAATYTALLKHANTLHIEVIPEFDMPGHSGAAITSLRSSPTNQERGTSKTGSYVVEDAQHGADYISGQNVKGNALNPCLPSTYEFIETLITEVKKLHEGVQPLKVFHFGGDEVTEDAWEGSARCRELAQNNKDLVSHYGKMKYFVQRVSQIASDHGLSVGAWEDGVLDHGDGGQDVGVPFPRGDFNNKDVYVYIWKNLVEKKTPHRFRLLANSGYKVVMSYGSYFYLDHPHETDPEERGLYWAARQVPLRRVWQFSPGKAQKDSNLDCPSGVEDESECFRLKKPENIIGIQAQLWSETVRTANQADYMLFPRLLAVAERAWHKASWEEQSTEEAGRKSRQGELARESVMHKGTLEERTTTPDEARKDVKVDFKKMDEEYGKFVDVIGRKELSRLEQLGVKYRVAPPGARVRDGELHYRTEFPSMSVEYFEEQLGQWKQASQSMRVTRPLKLRTRSSDGKRTSREVIVKLTSGSRDTSARHKHIALCIILQIFRLKMTSLIS